MVMEFYCGATKTYCLESCTWRFKDHLSSWSFLPLNVPKYSRGQFLTSRLNSSSEIIIESQYSEDDNKISVF